MTQVNAKYNIMPYKGKAWMQGVLGGVRGRGYTVVRKKVHIRVSVNIYSGGNFALPQDE